MRVISLLVISSSNIYIYIYMYMYYALCAIHEKETPDKSVLPKDDAVDREVDGSKLIITERCKVIFQKRLSK